jgi:hypothetical protein
MEKVASFRGIALIACILAMEGCAHIASRPGPATRGGPPAEKTAKAEVDGSASSGFHCLGSRTA